MWYAEVIFTSRALAITSPTPEPEVCVITAYRAAQTPLPPTSPKQ